MGSIPQLHALEERAEHYYTATPGAFAFVCLEKKYLIITTSYIAYQVKHVRTAFQHNVIFSYCFILSPPLVFIYNL